VALKWKHVFSVESPDGTVGFQEVVNSTQLVEDEFPEVAARIAEANGWPSAKVWLNIAPEAVEVAS